MPQYTFQTRDYGPNAKEETLTWEDLDYSLLFLSESINELNFNPLSGSNYIFIEANGTPTQNGLGLVASYALVKTIPPSSTNKFSILAGPGQYLLNSDFELDTEYLDVISLTGERDVYITGSGTIFVNSDNITVRGMDVDTKNFTITSSFPNTIIKNCKGGDYSFGGDSTLLNAFIMAGTFIDCEGGDYSFAGNGFAYGTFINCIGGDNSFGNNCDGIFTNCVGGDNSFATQGSIEGGTFKNCTGGDNSFASLLNIDQGSTLKECVGGINSFASSGLIYGLLQGCQLTLGNFNALNVDQVSGQLVSCFGDNFTPITTP